MGDFSRFMIGSRLDSRIEVLREQYANMYQYGFLAALRADVQWEHDASFLTLTNIKGTTRT